MVQLNMNTYASTKNKSSICMDCRLEHRDVEGATYINIIILIINVTIIITIIVYTRVAHEYQYTPNLRPLVLAPLTPRKLNIQCSSHSSAAVGAAHTTRGREGPGRLSPRRGRSPPRLGSHWSLIVVPSPHKGPGRLGCRLVPWLPALQKPDGFDWRIASR